MDEDSAALSSTAVPTDKVKVEFKQKTTRNANTAKEGGKGDAIDTINLISEDEDADGVVQDASGGAPASGWSGIDGTDNDGEGTLGTRKRTRQPAQGQQQQQAQKPKESALHQQQQQDQVWDGSNSRHTCEQISAIMGESVYINLIYTYTCPCTWCMDKSRNLWQCRLKAAPTLATGQMWI